MRVDEFSRHELSENHATIQELTSQIQALQDRMNHMNDSGEFQDVESICSGTLSHVPSQLATVPSLGGMLSRDQSLRPDRWNLLGTSGNVFGLSTSRNQFVIDTSNGSLLESKCHRRKPSCEIVQGNLSLEVKKEIERLFQRRDLQGDRQP